MTSEHLHNITDNKKVSMRYCRKILESADRMQTEVEDEGGDELLAVIGRAHVEQVGLLPLLDRHLTLPLHFHLLKDADKL